MKFARRKAAEWKSCWPKKVRRSMPARFCSGWNKLNKRCTRRLGLRGIRSRGKGAFGRGWQLAVGFQDLLGEIVRHAHLIASHREICCAQQLLFAVAQRVA